MWLNHVEQISYVGILNVAHEDTYFLNNLKRKASSRQANISAEL